MIGFKLNSFRKTKQTAKQSRLKTEIFNYNKIVPRSRHALSLRLLLYFFVAHKDTRLVFATTSTAKHGKTEKYFQESK